MPILIPSWKKRVIMLVLTAALASYGCSGSSGGDGGGYYGVFVGISNYQVSAYNLNYADDDAIEIAQTLAAGANWDWGNIILLLNEEAGKTAIREAIFAMASRMSSDDHFVFYFSGHGTFGPDLPPFDEADGLEEYLVPNDALRGSTANDISDDELESWLAAIPGSNVAVITDASWSGGIFKSINRVKFISRSDEAVFSGPTGRGNFLKDIGRPGYIVITASDDHESPSESSILQHGVFTYYLLEGLMGDADANGNLSISVEELYDFSAPRVNAFQGSEGVHPQMRDLHPGQFDLLKMR